jgi:cellulose synthase operon protein C
VSTAAITKLFEQIDSTPFGPEERALVDQAVALAVESGDEQLEHLARMRLTVSAKHSGDTDAMLSSFAWTLAKHDSDPQRFPADLGDGGADLLWQYKWMAGTLSASPIFSREQIDAIHADMLEHYERAGVGLSGVITSRFDEAWRNGRLDEAATLREQLAITPRDDYSHCDACVRSESAGFLAQIGREEEALALVEEMIEGGFSCGDEPENALSEALLPYLRAGRLDEAKSAHLRSYRLARDNADKISIIANHLVFCAVTGNVARGLALLERHISWLAHDGLNVRAHFNNLLAYGVLLDAIDRAGHGDAAVRGADSPDLVPFFGEHDGAWTVRDLASSAWRAAAAIGADFDARNGNDYYADSIARAHALADEHYDVPIDTDSFAPAPVEVAEPTDADGWRLRANELAASLEPELTIAAARRALDLGLAGWAADEAHSVIIGSLVRLEQWDEAAAALAARSESLRANKRDAQADFEARVGLAAFGRSTDEDRIALEAELASADLPPEVRADALLCVAALRMGADDLDVEELLLESVAGFDTPYTQRGLRSALLFTAHFYARTGRSELAIETVDKLIALEQGQGDLAQYHLFRGRVNGGLGRFDDGARDADEAARLFTLIGERAGAVDATSLAAALLADAGRADEAVSRNRFAVQQGEMLGIPTTTLRFSYGRSLVQAGRGEEAVEVLQQVFDDETAAEVPAGSRAETLYWVGHALQEAEQFGNAVGVWFSAAELYVEGGDTQGAAGANLTAARMLSRFGEHQDALDALVDAEELARKTPENVRLLTDVLHALGSAKAAVNDAGGLDNLDEVLRIARENEADWLAADVTDSKARALSVLGRTDEALSLALEAADLYTAAGDPASGGGSELYAARVLVEADRQEEAVALYRSAIDRAEGVPNLVAIASMELGDVLEKLGRLDEAAAAREGAEQ